MSEIKVDTLTGKTTANDITVTVGATATAKLEQSLAKVWGNIDGTGTIALRDSFNLSSLTDDGSGAYDTSFTNSFNNTTYAALGEAKENTSGSRTSDVDRVFNPARLVFTTSTCAWLAQTYAGADVDIEEAFPLLLGDLA